MKKETIYVLISLILGIVFVLTFWFVGIETIPEKTITILAFLVFMVYNAIILNLG
jgi:hypothetical protein